STARTFESATTSSPSSRSSTTDAPPNGDASDPPANAALGAPPPTLPTLARELDSVADAKLGDDVAPSDADAPAAAALAALAALAAAPWWAARCGRRSNSASL